MFNPSPDQTGAQPPEHPNYPTIPCKNNFTPNRDARLIAVIAARVGVTDRTKLIYKSGIVIAARVGVTVVVMDGGDSLAPLRGAVRVAGTS